MEKAKVKNPSLNARELRKVQRSAMKDAGFRSSKINTAHKVGDFLGAGTRDNVANMKKGQNFTKALKAGHSTADGKISTKKVAGTFSFFKIFNKFSVK